MPPPEFPPAPHIYGSPNPLPKAVISKLPKPIGDYLRSAGFARQCEARYASIDADDNGVLDPDELHPLLVSLTSSHSQVDVSHAHCVQFMTIFDSDHDGVITRGEFAKLCRFIVVMAHMRGTPKA